MATHPVEHGMTHLQGQILPADLKHRLDHFQSSDASDCTTGNRSTVSRWQAAPRDDELMDVWCDSCVGALLRVALQLTVRCRPPSFSFV